LSILLIEPDKDLGGAIVRRLLDEGDEVRVLAREPEPWKQLGAFVATGDPFDVDLVERACTNVRTIVFTAAVRAVPVSLVEGVLPAAAKAGTDRVIVCTPKDDERLRSSLEASGWSYAVLILGRRGFLPRKTVEPDDVATAVSAVDDIAGMPKVVADLATEEGWAKLGGHT
jgi:NAD(P)-dependent dehydrogenase (short-subunit alcohol dehydrogenase family)